MRYSDISYEQMAKFRAWNPQSFGGMIINCTRRVITFFIKQTLLLGGLQISAILLLPGCSSSVLVKVTFDDLIVGEQIDDVSPLGNTILDVSLTNDSTRQAEIRSSPVGTCGGFYSNDNELIFEPKFPADLMALSFAEYGGRNQVAVNDDVLEARDIVELDGISGDAYTIDVYAAQQGANWAGVLVVQGNIARFSVRGQELLIDDVIFRTNSNAVPSKVLLDVRVRGYPVDGDPSVYDEFRNLLISNGFEVDVHTSGTLGSGALDGYDVYIGRLDKQDSEGTLFGYEVDEPARLVEFVRNGHSAFLITEYGPTTNDDVFAFFLDQFGIQHQNNKVVDVSHSEIEDFWVFYERGRNFQCHPIVGWVDKVQFFAGATLVDASSETVIHTDLDSVPSDSPVLLARRFGEGRVVVVGDSSWLAAPHIGVHHNKALALAIVEWLSMRL